ncbi:DegT/DnrJ/EryC1/StrS family aminotransferase [Haloarcula brevis]|uniref:DegT/DnrJ/EryC1/StrS family aminotransferase n=1 Tax=Haloarcula brevis TaxID=3111453 RepID=UPI00300EA661
MPDRVDFTDIYVDDEIVERVAETLRSTRYVKGDRVEAFEDRFASNCGTDHAVAVNSGTAAILLSLRAAGVGEGDDVFVPGHTFFATVSPVLELRANPVFVDVNPETYTIDTAALEAAVERSESPTAVVPVHLYGQLADVVEIQELADKYDLTVVEDACQAHFATRDGITAGTAGTAGAFSFYPSKNMTVAGDGGMIVTDDEAIAEQARRYRNHGRDDAGVHRELGLNYRLSDVAATVGIEQLDRVTAWNQRRAVAASRYDDHLGSHPSVTTPTVAEGANHVYHLYVVQVPEDHRDALREYLDDNGIDTGVHYPTPAHRHPAVTERVDPPTLPTTEALCDRIVSLPMHPRIDDESIDRVCEAVEAYFEVVA